MIISDFSLRLKSRFYSVVSILTMDDLFRFGPEIVLRLPQGFALHLLTPGTESWCHFISSVTSAPCHIHLKRKARVVGKVISSLGVIL